MGRHLIFGALMLLGCTSSLLAADEDVTLRKFHPWGRFHTGSWSLVRVVTETLDENGKVTAITVTHTKSTLTERLVDQYALKVDASFEVGGKKIPSQPQTVRQGYADEAVGAQLTFRDVESASLTIDGREIPCSTVEFEAIANGQRRVTLVHYSTDVAPFPLHRKTVLTDLLNRRRTQETELSIVALDEPRRIAGESRRVARTRLIQRGAYGKTSTESVISPEVPGELVAQTSEKLDDTGRVTHRSKVELVSFHAAPEPEASAEENTVEVRVPRRYYKKNRHERR